MGSVALRYLGEGGKISWAYRRGTQFLAAQSHPSTLASFLHSPPSESSIAVDFESVELLPPVTAPCQIVCQGKNYLEHMLETGVKPKNKDFNLLFQKASSSLAPARGSLVRPKGVRLLDYELELGMVIRKTPVKGTKITRANIHEYVAGLVMANDVSARDIQIPERQWFKGKSFRGFCPAGPWIWFWDRDEVDCLDSLELELKVNGTLRQKAKTSQLLHGPEDTLNEIAGLFDLYPGDLLLTGTPGGVAMRVRPKSKWAEFRDLWKSDKEKFRAFVEEQAKSSRYLKPGDKLESSIRCAKTGVDLGRQELVVVDEL